MENFRFKKSLGQNFISDSNFLKSLVKCAGITEGDQVLEIGPGAGGLTRELCRVARKVVAYEIDTGLEPALSALTAEWPNLTVIYKDIMETDGGEAAAHFSGEFKLAANLPYYITTPIIFKFLAVAEEFPLKAMYLMMQKEVADRITAAPGGKDYGALTVAVAARADVRLLKNVPRTLFYPVPNVDSAFIEIALVKDKYPIKDMKIFDRLVKSAFAMRRKTLANNLSAGFALSKADAEAAIGKLNVSPAVRGEALSPAQFAALANILAVNNE